MPILRNEIAFEPLRGVRAFLTIEAGILSKGAADRRRSVAPQEADAAGPPASSVSQVERAVRRPAVEGNGRPRKTPVPYQSNVTAGDTSPENIIWIFGTARTGSTWLSAMMGEMANNRLWREPLVGSLFGSFHGGTLAPHFKRAHFILSDTTRKAWLDGIRFFVLNAIQAHFAGEDGYLVIGEPNGSVGAPLMMEALPESRMVLLVRDPRDVVASALDRNREGGDAYRTRAQDPRMAKALAKNPADTDPAGFIRTQARRYAKNISSARQAFENHRGHKGIVKYEDLRADTLGTMQRLYSALEIPVDRQELARVVEKHSWENIPAEQKGPGKSNRKAKPGGWREDLTPEQVEIVERVTAPLLKEFYPDSAVNGGGEPPS